MSKKKNDSVRKDKFFEQVVADIQKCLSPDAQVLWDTKMRDKDTGSMRQIDVLVTHRVGQLTMNIIIECKNLGDPVGVGIIEAFKDKISAVNANKGVMVSKIGFTSDAKKKAEKHGIELFIPLNEGGQNWEDASIELDTIFDSRDINIASLDFQFNLFMEKDVKSLGSLDLGRSCLVDKSGSRVGTVSDLILRSWNTGLWPDTPGIHRDVEVGFLPLWLEEFNQVRMRKITIKELEVRQTLFRNSMPLAEIFGFYDEINKRPIKTNAYKKGVKEYAGSLTFDGVLKGWTRIDQVPKTSNPVLIIHSRNRMTKLEVTESMTLKEIIQDGGMSVRYPRTGHAV